MAAHIWYVNVISFLYLDILSCTSVVSNLCKTSVDFSTGCLFLHLYSLDFEKLWIVCIGKYLHSMHSCSSEIFLNCSKLQIV